MASIGITESTFALCLLSEQMERNWNNLATFPILPSLIAEGGAGWDALLLTSGTALFLQFKLSDLMTHGNSAHHQFFNQLPYYRFHLHEHNEYQQHARLRQLSQSYPDTYYVAPEVGDIDGFYSAYIDRVVTEASRFVSVASCFDIEDFTVSHEIAYLPESNDAWQASKPERVVSIRGPHFDDLLAQSRRRARPVNLGFARDLVRALSEITHEEPRRVSIDQKADPIVTELRQASDLALQLGLHMLIVTDKQIPQENGEGN